jgi:hypothetical protein
VEILEGFPRPVDKNGGDKQTTVTTTVTDGTITFAVVNRLVIVPSVTGLSAYSLNFFTLSIASRTWSLAVPNASCAAPVI